MRYLCLVYGEESRLGALADEECAAFDENLREVGYCLAAEVLQSVQTATTVRVRNETVSVTDGPFAETKEQLAGFYLIEARDLNEAIRIAGRVPSARLGSVELRPIRDLAGRSRQRGAL